MMQKKSSYMSMKSVLSDEELLKYPAEFQNRVAAIRANRACINATSLEVNTEVVAMNLDELLATYDQTFFHG